MTLSRVETGSWLLTVAQLHCNPHPPYTHTLTRVLLLHAHTQRSEGVILGIRHRAIDIDVDIRDGNVFLHQWTSAVLLRQVVQMCDSAQVKTTGNEPHHGWRSSHDSPVCLISLQLHKAEWTGPIIVGGRDVAAAYWDVIKTFRKGEDKALKPAWRCAETFMEPSMRLNSCRSNQALLHSAVWIWGSAAAIHSKSRCLLVHIFLDSI